MNELKLIKNQLSQEMPELQLELDEAENEAGSSWLDIQYGEKHFTIEWQSRLGFGLYTNDDDAYGSGPTEIFRNKTVLLKRLTLNPQLRT